ncbi:very short patch repair endonuclease [Sinisalibacter aestuarii]|uniref:Very short patch repair endonuclease n=1 Tax=Sinisalibacter aestuarii TaxID=2949426 RepID=A0ABQ5LR22_9RHOB|nr:very short patch repair endonuclease [Sinisalibacter aestuarii]GKY87413.1 very short patch repair endonuclease [Sinisalibacter aestuarii]
MADIVAPEVRSRMMSRIRGRDTRAEVTLRKGLFARGFRYRVNDKRLPGSPDIVFPKWGAVIFVHGCYWHRHPGCPKAYMPKSRVDFWQAKFDENIRRDQRNIRNLLQTGWRVAVVWECAVIPELQPQSLDAIAAFLTSDVKYVELPREATEK